jgi:hypothetical protein
MASTVLSGTGPVTYTNNTGQNVRVVINYMANYSAGNYISMSWAGASATGNYVLAIGRNLAFTEYWSGGGSNVTITANNMLGQYNYNAVTSASLPTELMLAPGQTFSATCDAYNVVVIPEAG